MPRYPGLAEFLKRSFECARCPSLNRERQKLSEAA
jgi:hypothetical protein